MFLDLLFRFLFFLGLRSLSSVLPRYPTTRWIDIMVDVQVTFRVMAMHCLLFASMQPDLAEAAGFLT